MIANYKQIIDSIQSRNYAAVYVLDGEEPYFLDQLINCFENNILSPSEKEFNYSVLYGRDTSWAEVVNACRRFPMFAERQLVLLKDAGSMSDFNALLPYFEQPSPSTILVVEYRNKKVDGKTKIAKVIKEKTIYFNSEKIKEESMPSWIRQFGKDLGFQIPDKEAELLTMYLGNNLQKISNEIEKIRINVPNENVLSAALIQKHIGISREYNLFDFTDAFFSGDKEKTYRMMSYFIQNTRTVPMVLFTAGFYTKLNQLYKANHASKLPEKDWATAIGIGPYYAKTLVALCRRWSLPKIEAGILLIAQFNAKAVGIDATDTDAALMKEFLGKMELIELMN